MVENARNFHVLHNSSIEAATIDDSHVPLSKKNISQDFLSLKTSR